ncbi:MAG: hypothetical protein COA86_01650 [Kangiella sp.]|nr:MAG: hypothetical protein COA86_01650 [Kangiella sp.]
MNKNLLLIIILNVLLSPSAYALNSPNYTYLETAYIIFDDSGFEAKGIKLKGSIEISDYFFAVVDYNDTKGKINNFDVDFSTKGYGIGAKADLGYDDSFYISYTFNTWNLEAVSSDIDVDTLRVGYRRILSKNLELNTSYTSNRIEDTQKESGYSFGAVYYVSDNIQMTFDYDTVDKLKIISIGARVSF